MYCPKCAEPNPDAAKFCRACGEDLSVIAQVMARRFPVSVLSKMDAYLERKNERLRRDSVLGAVFATGFLFLCLYHLFIQKEGLSFNVILTLAMACLGYLWAAWDFMVYKRSLSRGVTELSPETDQVLPQQAHSTLGLSPASVTEQTTRHLKPKVDSVKKTS